MDRPGLGPGSTMPRGPFAADLQCGRTRSRTRNASPICPRLRLTQYQLGIRGKTAAPSSRRVACRLLRGGKSASAMCASSCSQPRRQRSRWRTVHRPRSTAAPAGAARFTKRATVRSARYVSVAGSKPPRSGFWPSYALLPSADASASSKRRASAVAGALALHAARRDSDLQLRAPRSSAGRVRRQRHHSGWP